MPFAAPHACKCGRIIPAGKECPHCNRDRRRRADANRPNARQRGYDSKWDKARATFLSHRPHCNMCGKPASVVDHVIPHRGDQGLFWDKNNWQSLCVTCHSSSKQRQERVSPAAQARAHPFIARKPRIPVTIVCGPVGAGKSTYVAQHAGPNDIVIDLDVIRARLARVGVHDVAAGSTAAALDERNRILKSLADDITHDKAWFIVSAPDPKDRETWAKKLNGNAVVIDTPIEECIQRIRADPSRRGQWDRMEKLAREWWEKQNV